MAINITVNGQPHQVDVEPDTPLLWVIRDTLGMTGTKFGCGMAQCGACTVHLNGTPIRSCVTPVSSAINQQVTTIEGLSIYGEPNDEESRDSLTPIQQAWIEEDVAQCGYCQSGQIMSAAALLASNPNPSDNDIDNAMSGNICRCGSYPRIRKAIKRAAVQQWEANNE